MSEVLPQLGLVVVLVLLNAAFAGTELAMVSLRAGQLQRIERQSATGKVLAALARQPNRFLATIQIGITLAGFLASAAAAVTLAEPLREPLGFLGGMARPVSILVVTLLLSYVTLVFGELAPKRVAMQKAERWGLVMARPVSFLATLARPAVWLLSRSTDIAVRLMGGDPSVQREEMTDEELRDLLATHVEISPMQRRIIDGAFEIAEHSLAEILVPRSDVVALDAEWTCADALAHLAASGNSRAPVATRGNLDHVVGSVHLRQLLAGGDAPVASVAMDLPAFPSTAKVLTTLRELQRQRLQMALVVDEHGGVEGIVTVEDLVEELVGELYDEADPEPVTVRHEPGGTIAIPGRYPLHELPELGFDPPDGEYATAAGLVLAELGRIPVVGDEVTIDEWRFEVRAMGRRAIVELALTPPTESDGAPAAPRDV